MNAFSPAILLALQWHAGRTCSSKLAALGKDWPAHLLSCEKVYCRASRRLLFDSCVARGGTTRAKTIASVLSTTRSSL